MQQEGKTGDGEENGGCRRSTRPYSGVRQGWVRVWWLRLGQWGARLAATRLGEGFGGCG